MLSNLALECIRPRFSDSNEAPQLHAKGFRVQIDLEPAELANRLQQRNQITNRTKCNVALPRDPRRPSPLWNLCSFLGFQRANAKDIFADFASPENKKTWSQGPRVTSTRQRLWPRVFLGQMSSPWTTCSKLIIILTQVFVGFDLDGNRREIIDQPEKPLVLSTVNYLGDRSAH